MPPTLQIMVAKQILELTDGVLAVSGFESTTAVRLPPPGPVRDDVLHTIKRLCRYRVSLILSDNSLSFQQYHHERGEIVVAVVKQGNNPGFDWWQQNIDLIRLRESKRFNLLHEYIVAALYVRY
jgi:hypothetical protein